MTMSYTKGQCRMCDGGRFLTLIHSFGPQPVAGYLDDDRQSAKAAPRFDNAVGICDHCYLVQQMNNDAHEILERRVYSGYQRTYSMSKKVSSYLAGFLEDAFAVSGVARGEPVIEIGSNDGSLLHLVAERGCGAFGFDPSGDDTESSVHVIRDFFTLKTARDFVTNHGSVKLVVSRHTLEHAFQPRDFFLGIRDVLAPTGRAVVEIPYVVHQIANNQFQSFTFQHVSFFSVHSMTAAASSAGLLVEDFRFVEMDGGSMVVVLRRAEGRAEPTPGTDALLRLERSWSYERVDPYADYFRAFVHEKEKARKLLAEIRRGGTHVVGYGAGSKGQALVNMLELGEDHLDGVIDDTPGTAGKFIPGVALAVFGRDDQEARNAECILLTAPTHAREIVAKERQHRGRAVYLGTAPRFGCL
jgi:methylation protein EvaC